MKNIRQFLFRTLFLLSAIPLAVLVFIPSNLYAKIDDSNIKSVAQIRIWDSQANAIIGTGSGVFIDGTSILTNYHVIEDSILDPERYALIVCMTTDSQSLPDCNYIYSPYSNGWNLDNDNLKVQKDLDLAIITIDAINTNSGVKKWITTSGAELASALNHSNIKISIYGDKLTGLKAGDEVQTLGYPAEGGDTITYSDGSITNFIVNNENRVLAITTSARITPGSSGGAAFDAYGKFIGITSAYFADNDGDFISGVIIPVSTVNWWLQEVEGYRVNKNDEYTIVDESSEKAAEGAIKVLDCIWAGQVWDEEKKICLSGESSINKSETTSKLNCAKGDFPIKTIEGKCGTPIESCETDYGTGIYYTGILNKDGSPLCDCSNGYKWNSSHAGCEISTTVTSDINNIPEGAIIKTADNPDVYIVKYVGTKKFIRLILSPSVFKSYGHLKWENIITVPRSTLDSYAVSDYVRVVGDTIIYHLDPKGDTGEKSLLKLNAQGHELLLTPHAGYIDYPQPFDYDSVYEINVVDRDSYITK